MALLDTVMINNPTLPPSGTTTVFKIKDIWDFLSTFNISSGQTFKLYYSESVLGSGNMDTIELHLNASLSTQQRNKVVLEYGKLIS